MAFCTSKLDMFASLIVAPARFTSLKAAPEKLTSVNVDPDRSASVASIWCLTPFSLIVCSVSIVNVLLGDRRAYAILGKLCSASIAAFTSADTASVSRTVNPVVEITFPIRISSGWHLM